MNDPQSAPRLYPVPAKEYTIISLPNGTARADIKLYDMNGRLLKSKTMVNGEKIQLDGIQPGLYNVLIAVKEKQYYERLIIQ